MPNFELWTVLSQMSDIYILFIKKLGSGKNSGDCVRGSKLRRGNRISFIYRLNDQIGEIQ